MEEITNNVALEIVVDDGSVKVPIKNKFGEEMGVFYFRPTDAGLFERYNELVDKLDDIVAPLGHVSIDAEGNAADSENTVEVEALREAERRLKEACDYMFGGNMSDAFFGKMHPFSPVNGYFYCEQALEGVGKFISAQYDEEVKKINKRMGKYLQQYKTGRKRKTGR